MLNKDNSLYGFHVVELPGRFKPETRRRTVSNTPNFRVSKYSPNKNGAQVTLNAPIIKALWIYMGLEKRNYALGKLSNGCYAVEMESSTVPNLIELVLYDPSTGKIQASCRKTDIQTDIDYNFNNEYSKTHNDESVCHNTDGTAVWLALMPEIMTDDEAIKAKGEIEDILSLVTDEAKATYELMSPLTLLNDNIYRRTLTDGEAAIVIEDCGKKGPLKRISGNKIAAGREYSVREVIAGDFQIFSASGTVQKKVEISDGEYNLGLELNDVQRQNMRPLPEGHVSSAVEKEILETIKKGYENPVFKVSNFLLVGPPGAGKSQTAIAVAYHLGLPYFTVICSDGMTEDDFRGAIYPAIGEMNESSQTSNSPTPLSESFEMPDDIEIRFDPEKAYRKLMGRDKPGVTSDEVLSLAYAQINDRCRMLEEELVRVSKAEKNGLEYVYVPSPVVQAFQHGGVLEIQEPSAIMSQTVLTFLNDIMNSEDGVLMTPYGPIKRNPNCIVIATNNPDSDEGYKCLNQAVKDRFQHIHWVDLPPTSVMIDRVVNRGISSDIILLEEMADVIQILAQTAKDKRIKGTAGMRSYIEWCKAVACGSTLRNSLEFCVINKMTNNPKEQEVLFAAVEDNSQIFKRDVVK